MKNQTNIVLLSHKNLMLLAVTVLLAVMVQTVNADAQKSTTATPAKVEKQKDISNKKEGPQKELTETQSSNTENKRESSVTTSDTDSKAEIKKNSANSDDKSDSDDKAVADDKKTAVNGQEDSDSSLSSNKSSDSPKESKSKDSDKSTSQKKEAAKDTGSKKTVAATVNIKEAPLNKSDDKNKMDGVNFISDDVPVTDRVINVPTSATVRRGTLVLTVDHRAHKTFISGEDAWFDYLGLDAGSLKIGFGLRYGITSYIDAGFYRLSNGTDLFDVYEFDTKLRLMKQKHQYVNVSLKLGGTWFCQKDAKDAGGFYGQLIIDRRLFKSLLFGTGFAFHTDSSNDKKVLADKKPSAAVFGYIEWRPVTKFSLNGEIAANVAGFSSKYPVFAFSARMLTYRHTFSIVVSNSQYMSADGIVSNSWRGFKHLVFGFQITREFNLINK